MTEKLYEKDALLKECTAIVRSCEQCADRFEIILDRTVIFPEGGGQLSDEGKIGEAGVFHAVERSGEVVHYADRPLSVGAEVTVRLNWLVRLDHMEQHCGEHILSHACWKLWGANNVGFHMHEDIVTIDLDKELTALQIKAAENYANFMVRADKPVTVSYLPDTELAALHMRKWNTKIKGILRLVSIEGGDRCTCCGTHPPRTGMVGLIKIYHSERYKGGSRLTFGCGMRALRDAQMRYRVINDSANALSVKVEDTLNSITRLQEEIVSLNAHLKEKTAAIYELRIAQVLSAAPVSKSGYKVVVMTQEATPAESKMLLSRLGEENDLLVGIISQYGERLNYFFAVTLGATGDAKAYCQKANAVFGGKGGGKANFAQGGAVLCADWQEKAKLVREYMVNEG